LLGGEGRRQLKADGGHGVAVAEPTGDEQKRRRLIPERCFTEEALTDI
jgi:hypothetical protein